MTYGHAERNLAFIRQLEAETRQLRCHHGPDGASLAPQPVASERVAAADQGDEYSREVQQQPDADVLVRRHHDLALKAVVPGELPGSGVSP